MALVKRKISGLGLMYLIGVLLVLAPTVLDLSEWVDIAATWAAAAIFIFGFVVERRGGRYKRPPPAEHQIESS